MLELQFLRSKLLFISTYGYNNILQLTFIASSPPVSSLQHFRQFSFNFPRLNSFNLLHELHMRFDVTKPSERHSSSVRLLQLPSPKYT